MDLDHYVDRNKHKWREIFVNSIRESILLKLNVAKVHCNVNGFYNSSRSLSFDYFDTNVLLYIII